MLEGTAKDMLGDIWWSVLIAVGLAGAVLLEIYKAARDDTPESLVLEAVIGTVLLAAGLTLLAVSGYRSLTQPRCPACGERVRERSAVCLHCGQLLDERWPGRVRCAACDEPISARARVCPHCGSPRKPADPTAAPADGHDR
jgi:Double zinc ribbon